MICCKSVSVQHFLGTIKSIASKISASGGLPYPNRRYHVGYRRLGHLPTAADREKVTGSSSMARSTGLTTTWARSCGKDNGCYALKAISLKIVATAVENGTCMCSRGTLAC